MTRANGIRACECAECRCETAIGERITWWRHWSPETGYAEGATRLRGIARVSGVSKSGLRKLAGPHYVAVHGPLTRGEECDVRCALGSYSATSGGFGLV